MSLISPIESSRERMTREAPSPFQNSTSAQLTLFACTEMWRGTSMPSFLMRKITPGSETMNASGFSAAISWMSRLKVSSLELCGWTLVTT